VPGGDNGVDVRQEIGDIPTERRQRKVGYRAWRNVVKALLLIGRPKSGYKVALHPIDFLLRAIYSFQQSSDFPLHAAEGAICRLWHAVNSFLHANQEAIRHVP
jgi:hypothetical protein